MESERKIIGYRLCGKDRRGIKYYLEASHTDGAFSIMVKEPKKAKLFTTREAALANLYRYQWGVTNHIVRVIRVQ